MDSELLIARLALARGLISPEAYRSILDRASAPGMVEDSLRGAGLSAEQLNTLRGALHIKKQEVLLGDWRLLRRIGVGGMGSVFEVRHRRTGRRAALKILLPRLGRDPEFTLRFLQEARALARISHPNVVHAYDAGKSGDFHFIAMELVEGEDLQRVLERVGCLAPVRSAEVMLEVARALQAIQSAGIIHRDVKPANILIDPAGAVKLTDLGLFHDDMEREVLWDGTVFGTPQYMSPEQVQGSQKIDIRSDLYSLGATWYHVLIGRPMFPGTSLGKVARAQVEILPVPPRDIRPDVPLVIDRLIMNLLEKDPACRPSGPEEVILSIEGILLSMGLLKKAARTANGHPPGPSTAGKSTRPSRRLLLAGGVVAGLLALLIFIGIGRALFTNPRDVGGKGAEPSGEAAVAGGDARAAEALESMSGLVASLVNSPSWRVLDRALPTIPTWLSLLKAGPRHDGGTAAPQVPERVPPMNPAIPEGVLAWAVEGAMEARARFLTLLSTWPRTLPIEVVLRSGEVVKVRVPETVTRERALEFEDGRPIAVASLHPASVIAWAVALAPDLPIPDRGAGLSIREGFLPGARMVLEAFAPSLPQAARSFILSGADETVRTLAGAPALSIESMTGNEPGPPPAPSGAAEAFLSRSFRDSQKEWAARDGLRSGRYPEAARAFAELLSADPPSPQAELRRGEWVRLRDRGERLSFITGNFFATGGSPVDALRDDAVIVRYPFDGEGELRDFRFEPRAWSLAEGALRRAAFAAGVARRPPAAGGSPDRKKPDFPGALDTLALFAPPVTVKGAWTGWGERAPRIAVGYAGRFAVLGTDSVLATWRGELEDGRVLDTAGRVEPAGARAGKVIGRFHVEFLADHAFAEFAGGRRVPLQLPTADAPALLPPGRVAIGLDPGGSLEDLEIMGTPDPVWAEARIEEIRKREPR